MMGHRVLLVVAMMIAAMISVNAQVNVYVTFRNPTPSQLSAWQRDPSVAQVRIINRGEDLPRMRLSVAVYDRARNRTVAYTNNDSREIPRFDVPGGGKITTLAGQQVINVNSVLLDKSVQAMAAQTQSLPEGEYQVCVMLLNDDGEQAPGNATSCTDINIIIADPPTLVFPVEDQIVDDEALMFRWTPVLRSQVGADVEYDLVVVPIVAKENPAVAIERNERLLVKRLQRPEFLMTKAERPLTVNGAKRFAWRVRAVYRNGQPATSNSGYSEAGSFRIDRSAPSTIQRPDTLVLNGYAIAVTSWNPTDRSGAYSGRGCLVTRCDRRKTVVPTLPRERSMVQRPTYSWSEQAGDTTSSATRSSVPPQTFTRNVRMPRAAINQASITGAASCADVAFEYVQWTGEAKRTMTAVQGLVTYPATPQSESSLSWYPSDNIVVDIDSLIITATTAKASGSAYHTTAFVERGTGEPGRFPFPLTALTAPCDLLVRVSAETTPMYIGETQCAITARDYTIDASLTSTLSGVSDDVSIMLPNVRVAPRSSSSVVSNTGYQQLELMGRNGVVTDKGLSVDMALTPITNTRQLQRMTIPYGHEIAYTACAVRFVNSEIADGWFEGYLYPDSLHRDSVASTNGIYARQNCVIDSTGSIRIIVSPSQGGAFSFRAGVYQGPTVFRGTISPMNGAKIYAQYPSTWVRPLRWEPFRMQKSQVIHEREPYAGILISDTCRPSLEILASRDVRNQPFTSTQFLSGQLLLGAGGVHADLVYSSVRDSIMSSGFKLGRISDKRYRAAQSSFSLMGIRGDTTNAKTPRNRNYYMSLTSDAVTATRIAGTCTLPNNTLTFSVDQQPLTATLDAPASWIRLDSAQSTQNPWSIVILPEEGERTAGVMESGRGTVNLSGSRLHEPVHFTRPFTVRQLEFVADGTVGSSALDANTAGQEFDGFPYAPDAVILSPVPTPPGTTPYLASAGMVDIPFFGLKYVNITDAVSETTERPFRGRRVTVARDTMYGLPKSDLVVAKSDAMGEFAFTMGYDETGQDGFVGKGTADIEDEGRMPGSLTVRRNSVCFAVKDESVWNAAGPPYALLVGALKDRWACGCVEDDAFTTIGSGGRVVANGTVGGLLRSGVGGEVTRGRRHNVSTIWVQAAGMINMFVTDIDGRFLFQGVTNDAEQSLRGTLHLNGTTSSMMGGVTIDAALDLYHRTRSSNDIWYAQGTARVVGQAAALMSGGYAELQGGVFIGRGVPREQAWVLAADDARFKLRDEFLPSSLTGFYAYGGVRMQFDMTLVQGRSDVHYGVGGFMGSLVTTAGVDLHGAIARGLIHASALVNLQAALGSNSGLAGRTVLQGCVDTIMFGKYCASVALSVSISERKGLVIE